MTDYKRNIDELRKLSPTADQRLWACHQACAGIPTEQLEALGVARVLAEIHETARRKDWTMETYTSGDAFDDLDRISSLSSPFRKD